jgi:hypothetical protein
MYICMCVDHTTLRSEASLLGQRGEQALGWLCVCMYVCV